MQVDHIFRGHLHVYSGLLSSSKAGCFYRDLVQSNREIGCIIETTGVAHQPAGFSGCGPFDRDLCSFDHGPRWIGDCAPNFAPGALSVH